MSGRAATRLVDAGRRLTRRVQRPALVLGGFALVTCAAWDLSRPLGLLAGGLSCLIVEALTKGEGG